MYAKWFRFFLTFLNSPKLLIYNITYKQLKISSKLFSLINYISVKCTLLKLITTVTLKKKFYNYIVFIVYFIII